MGIRLPHISEKNKEDHIFTATNLLSRQSNDPFHKIMITGHEKWVFKAVDSQG